MKKYILFFVILIMVLSGCLESGSTQVVNAPDSDKRDFVATDATTDAGISVKIISKPSDKNIATSLVDTDPNVDIQFMAFQTGESASNFTYHYTLLKDGAADPVNSLADNVFVPNTLVRFYGLSDAIGKYTFTVIAYNKRTKKMAVVMDMFEFKIVPPKVISVSTDVVIKQFESDKKIVQAKDQIKLTAIVTNSANVDYNYIADVNFGVWQNSAKFVSTDGNGVIKANETKTITMTYDLTESLILTNLNTTAEVKPSLNITLTGVGLTVTPMSTTLAIYDPANARVKVNYIEVLTGGASGVTPGQSGIKIRYNFTNKSKNRIYVKKLTPRFYTAASKDVTAEWLDSTNQDIVNNAADSGASFSITRIYTLSNAATAGDVFVDTAIEVTLGEAYGATTKDDKAETVGKTKVMKVGTAALNAWIALPSGSKTGSMYTGQEFTVYGIVNYDGEAKASDVGNLEIFFDEIDGAVLTGGTKNQGFDLNKQYSWTIRTSTNPIAGNIYVKVTKKPQMTLNNSDTGTVINKEFTFSKEIVTIPITTAEKSFLVLEAGVELDTYGAMDGLVKSDTDFKLYAIAKNGNSSKLSGTVRITVDYSDFNNMKLSPGEVNFKDVPIDTKAVFSLRAPPSKGTGNIHFTVSNIPADPITGLVPSVLPSNSNNKVDYKVNCTLGGMFVLNSVTCDWSEIKPGTSGIPIKFELTNRGNEPVKITDIKAVFTQKEVDVSDRWELVSTSLRGDTLITEESGALTCTAYYRLKDNIGDATDLLHDVTVSGVVTGKDVTAGVVVTAEKPRYNCIIAVKDIVAPIASAGGKDITAKVGELVLLDASKSTDNDQIRYYNWDITKPDKSVVRLNGIKVSYIFTEPGVYKATLTINDMQGNGPSEDSINIIITN